MRRFLVCALAILMVVVVLYGFSSVPPTEKGVEYTWKMALNSTAGNNGYDTGAVFADKIAELTNGRVKVVLYGGSTLGSTVEVLEGMFAGVADIMCESVSTLAPFTPLANIDAMPYLYSGYDHFMKVWNSELGDEMRDTVGKAGGFKLLGATYRGPRIVTATKKMVEIKDFEGFKLRAPGYEMYIKTWQWMKAAPMPLAMNEVYTALQQKIVDGQENPIGDSMTYALDEVCKYWIKTNHVYGCNVLIMDLNYYNSLPEDIKEAARAAAAYAGEQVGQLQLKQDVLLEQKLIEKGCEVVPVDVGAFLKYFDGFAEANYPNLSDWARRIAEMDPEAQ